MLCKVEEDGKWSVNWGKFVRLIRGDVVVIGNGEHIIVTCATKVSGQDWIHGTDKKFRTRISISAALK